MRVGSTAFLTALLLVAVSSPAKGASTTTGNFEFELDGNFMTLKNKASATTTKMECVKAGRSSNMLEIHGTATATIDAGIVEDLYIKGNIDLAAGMTNPDGELKLNAQLAATSGTLSSDHSSADWDVNQGTVKWDIHADGWNVDDTENFEVHFKLHTDADVAVDTETKSGVEMKVITIGGDAVIQMPLEFEADASGEFQQNMEVKVDGDVIKCIFPGSSFQSRVDYDPTTDNGAVGLTAACLLTSVVSAFFAVLGSTGRGI
eukprot:gb/GECG01012356.1/.p1 GENE.gb/GECG01012356.1/~~gb/GECG01012356.1/.p1  ORF type:complete len:261 (+),score=43.82 gb/GECG01012356.1/:1-783(+)